MWRFTDVSERPAGFVFGVEFPILPLKWMQQIIEFRYETYLSNNFCCPVGTYEAITVEQWFPTSGRGPN
jgi:hypothetical protein